MRHHITKDFPISSLTSGFIDCSLLYRYIKSYKIDVVDISISDIRAKPMSAIEDWNLRYKMADITLPCIIIKEDDYYQLIDGRHRLKKSIDMNLNKIPCYILTPKQVLIAYTN